MIPTTVTLLYDMSRIGINSTYVTEFWKITHMGVREIIRIFMFSGLLIRAENSFENISRIFL